jgi:hypothetical protein
MEERWLCWTKVSDCTSNLSPSYCPPEVKIEKRNFYLAAFVTYLLFWCLHVHSYKIKESFVYMLWCIKLISRTLKKKLINMLHLYWEIYKFNCLLILFLSVTNATLTNNIQVSSDSDKEKTQHTLIIWCHS